ncbi:MAG: hypothetical protein HYZ00_12900 [Candidatus Hydrogenedentes bacterium]|nr:hypothetical protein [Candidatus Hydrogenedentota bacterium]
MLKVALLCLLAAEVAPGQDFATFSAEKLGGVIGNNAPSGEHREHYNGVFSLAVPDQDASPFVPLYAGLNLEHFFDGRPRSPESSVFFEPRHAPMTFKQIDDKTSELHQPETPVYGVESWTRFTLRDPYYVDMDFRCVPHKDVFQGGFFGVFWASYINAPEDKSIFFLQSGDVQTPGQWVQMCTQKHGVQSSVLAADDNQDLAFEATGDVLYANLSPLRYSAPFYYGRWRGQVLIFIFQPGPVIRFAHSPSGGGNTEDKSDTNPAWDFQLIVPDYEIGKEYGLKMRLVCKPWVDREDVLNEVRKYLAAKS